MATPLEELKDRLALRPEHILIVVGSGVTVASTQNAPVASWGGLLDHGIGYCVDHLHLPENWAYLRREQLKLGEFIEVASEISKQLGAPRSGPYAGWLQGTVGKLVVSEPRLIRSLTAWGSPIATTNYDTLISQQTGLEPITWQDRAWLAQFFDGEIRGVLHLHGVYSRPETVVLGARSYEDVIRDRTIQDVMKALVIGKTLVFVGCGPAGLGDPNLGGLMLWYREILGETVRPSYLLVSGPESEGWRRGVEGSQIRLVVYGASHADLPAFLEQLAEQARRGRPRERPPDDLFRAQPTFDQRVRELLSGDEEGEPGERLRRLMELVRSHWEAGGRRSAWMAAVGRLKGGHEILRPEERVRFSLELADMIFRDGLPDRAFEVLRETLPDVESGEIGQDQRHQYWGQQALCLQAMGPYTNTTHALERAIATSPDDPTRLRLEAELAEVRFLQGDDSDTQDPPEGVPGS